MSALKRFAKSFKEKRKPKPATDVDDTKTTENKTRNTKIAIEKEEFEIDRDPNTREEEFDCIIVGAGVAGASLAFVLAKEGRKVLCIERDLSLQHRIVGELLQPGGYLKLKELGLAECVEEIDAQKVYGYTMYKDGEEAQMNYPIDEKMIKDDIAGRSFHNGRFVQRLRKKAYECENVRLREGTVKALVNANGEIWNDEKTDGAVCGVSYDIGGDKWINDQLVQTDEKPKNYRSFAPLTIVCDGHFSSLRKKLADNKIDHPSHFVGLILDGKPSEILGENANQGHVVLGDPSPVLFYPISSKEVRCLVDIPANVKMPRMKDGSMAKYIMDQILPQVPKRIQPYLKIAVEKGDFKAMPNKTMPANPKRTKGAVLLGDSFNMRHPLTGGGMTVALSDIATFKSTLQPLGPSLQGIPSEIQKAVDEFYAHRTRPALTINTLANALYKVFTKSENSGMEEMRKACFQYLKLGGGYARGPVALLSGLDPNPLNLVTHFFAVAIFGIGRLLVPLPTPERCFEGLKVLSGATQIIFPIVNGEGVARMFLPASIRRTFGYI
jgi:squalene monooxygenase